MRIAHIFLLSSVLGLSACEAPGPLETPCTMLIGGGEFCLQATSARAPFAVQQKVEARFRDRRETFIADIESDDSGLNFVGLTPFGQTLFHASYDNRESRASRLPDKRISPSLLIALLQIALWPAESVSAGLSTPFTLEDSTHQRRIVDRGVTTLSITYFGDGLNRPMLVSIPAADLELRIETLPVIEKEP